MKRFLPFGSVIFSIVLLADQYTKHLIAVHFMLGESVNVFPGLWLTYIHNTGSLFGLFQDSNTAFIWLSIFALGILLYFHEEFETTPDKVAYVLILSGLAGNFLDRVLRGFVVDFIDLGWWPIFNIADSAISVGIILYIVMQFKKGK